MTKWKVSTNTGDYEISVDTYETFEDGSIAFYFRNEHECEFLLARFKQWNHFIRMESLNKI
jgi:hypothetical protein